MKIISEFNEFRRFVLPRRTIHVLTAGFEVRCLGYAEYVSALKPSIGLHRVLCIDPLNEGVIEPLIHQRQANRRRMTELFPGLRVDPVDEVVSEIEQAGGVECLCIDMSTMPRRSIFGVLSAAHNSGIGNIYAIYCYPKEYNYGELQEPSHLVDELPYGGGEEKSRQQDEAAVVLIPGFDYSYTAVSLAYLGAKYRRITRLDLMIPLSGMRYGFYERALETHLTLLREATVALVSQDSLNDAVERICRHLDGLAGKTINIVPLGPRIMCAAVNVAVRKLMGLNPIIVLPRTRGYRSLRSSGAQDPLIERLRTL